MKKLLLSIGTFAAAAAPVAAVVACGDKDEAKVMDKASAVTALSKLTTEFDSFKNETGTVAIHFKFAKAIEYTSYAGVTSDSNEVVFYKESNGQWRVSHSAGWTVPFMKATGAWVMGGTAPTEAQITTALSSSSAMTTFKNNHSKDMNETEVKLAMAAIVTAIAKDKIQLTAGDTVVVNDLKHDSNFWKQGSKLVSIGSRDHLSLATGKNWSKVYF